MAPYAPPEDLELVAFRAGRPPQAVIKLDANENPYGPSPRVNQALAAFDRYHRYPDPEARSTAPLVAAYAGVAADRIVLGNGSDELIDLVCRIYLEPGDEGIDCTPTFGMYRFSTELCGGRAVEAPRTSDWRVDADCVREAITPRTKLIFVATPNNPTGNPVDEGAVRALLEHGLIVVLDEAYVEFSPHGSYTPWTAAYDNLVVLRTFSKWAGLAGLRIGYGVFPPALASYLQKVKPPFNVNLAAEVAVHATLEDLPGVRTNVEKIVAERERMATALAAVAGMRVWPSAANFLLLEVGASGAASLKTHLAARGIAVRAYEHPRLRNALRISVGLPEHTNALVAAIREWREKPEATGGP